MFSELVIKKASKKAKNPYEMRERVGKISSIVGIGINVVLCSAKIMAGIMFNSVSISADGINNLSDAGNSLISLISFKLSSRPADKDHPFGHARYEYIASLIVAFSILLLGFEMIKTSFDKIIHPEELSFSWLSVIVLIVSILAKCWMYFFNHGLAKKIDSTVLQATAVDSLSDTISTSGVLVSLFISHFFHFNLDGFMGIIVAGFIMFSGYNILKDTLDALLGTTPDYELVQLIKDEILKHDEVYGLHDLMVHNYGPQRCFASVHVEVDSKVDILKSHDLIDNIEKEFLNEHGLHVVIHLDPIVVDDPHTSELYDFIKKTVNEIDDSLNIHDFRAVLGETHCNLIFDLVVPYECHLKEEEIEAKIQEALKQRNEHLYTVITFERPFN